VTGDAAINHLFSQASLMGARQVILSTNVPLRRDGTPYRDTQSPADPGVALYWSTDSFKDRVIVCDNWDHVHANIRAIGLTLEHMRGIERAAGSQVLNRAFTSFGALPAGAAAPVVRPWWEVFCLKKEVVGMVTLPMVEAQYRDLATKAHPDKGGSEAAMAELNRAREEARAHFGGRNA
jgi:hypothetical protein